MSDTASWWFGTRGYERWIKMTAADMDNVYSGRNARTDQINGGVPLLQSAAGHKEYSLSWAGRIDDMDGIHSILTTPSGLTVNTINKDLELKARRLI